MNGDRVAIETERLHRQLAFAVRVAASEGNRATEAALWQRWLRVDERAAALNCTIAVA